MSREWVAKEELLSWIGLRLAQLEDCEKCDNPSKKEPIGIHKLRGNSNEGVNWAAETPYYLCYHQCRTSREKVMEEAVSRFNIKWD